MRPTDSSTRATEPQQERRPVWRRPGTLWIAFDLLVPTALLYVMLWNGTGLYAAFLVSGAFSAVSALVSYRLRKGGQQLAPYMLVLALAGFAIALVTGSERFLLAKESVLTAMVGVWFLGSIWTARPLAYRFARPMLEGRFGLHGPPWEQLWEEEPQFRRIWKVSSVMWAAATLIDAVVRVVMAYTLPVNSVPALQTGLFIVTLVLMQPITHVYYARAGLWQILRGGGARNEDTVSLAAQAN